MNISVNIVFSLIIVIIVCSMRHRLFIKIFFFYSDFSNWEHTVKDIYRHEWNFFLFSNTFDRCELRNYYYYFFLQLISIYLTKRAALAIRLWCSVDTTANENRLRRRTIRTNACTQEQIIEFLSILHYNESLDISTGWAPRTLQSMDNYLKELNLRAQSERGRELHYTGG